MSIAELFESGEKKSNKGHFRNLIMIARADGVVSESEQKILDKMGMKIGLNAAQIQEVIDNPSKYRIHPPVNLEDRYERLIGLVEMLSADDIVDEHEVHLMHRFGIGLGFEDDKLEPLVERILSELMDGKSKWDILEDLTD
ncbi:MAG: hypothetical protein ACI8XB_003223 [Patiriisocius sp.]|jgi:hypothetical protein